MNDQIEEFVNYLLGVKKTSTNTIISYKRDLERMAGYMEKRGITSVSDITGDRLMDYAASLREENFAPTSIIRHNTSMKAFFKYMIENGNIIDDPTVVLKSPKATVSKPRVLSEAEVQALLSQNFPENAKGVRDKAILELLYATGLKAGELVSLELSNIDLSIGCLRLNKGKEKSAERIIPFGKMAKDALMHYLLDARAKLCEGEDVDKIKTVFLNCDGNPMSRQGLWKLIKTYVKKAGISSDITPYSLRHSFAAHLVDNGADIASIQDMLGFNDSNTLSRYIDKEEKAGDPYEWARLR
ncbi:MAG: tyrosine-type recombinase/integrase [Butyrivibrio sp.]|nr:tyrosine-type recombinase/integrase [Butyrivibrio sp.]